MLNETLRVTETCERVVRWIEEGQALLGVVRGIAEEHERLKHRMEQAERDVERLEQELAALETQNERFRRERAEAAEALGKAIGALGGPLRDVISRLEGSPGSPLA